MKRKNKIIFLREGKFLEKDYLRFDIEYLEKFFEVIVLNCFPYFNYKTKCILRNTINVKNVTFHSRLFGIVAKN